MTVAAGTWTRRTGQSGTYLGTTTTTNASGATLTRTNVQAKRLALVVTKVPDGGSIRVYWNGAPLTSSPISLAASTTQKKQLVTFPAFCPSRQEP